MVNVLVVDDDPVAVAMVQDILRYDAVTVRTAYDWMAMNEEMRKRSFAVVILDVKLPGVEGDQLAGIISRHIRPRPRIVLHSSIEPGELRRLARAVGAVNHVQKGESSALELRRAVQAALRDFVREQGEEGLRVASGGSSAPAPRSE